LKTFFEEHQIYVYKNYFILLFLRLGPNVFALRHWLGVCFNNYDARLMTAEDRRQLVRAIADQLTGPGRPRIGTYAVYCDKIIE